MIDLLEEPRGDTFDAERYLAANLDVARDADASGGRLGFAARHYSEAGRFEGRRQFTIKGLRDLQDMKAEKLDLLRSRDPIVFEGAKHHEFAVGGQPMSALLPQRETAGLPLALESVIANPYDQTAEDLFDQAPEGLFLDLGAGLRPVYRPNVLNVEVGAFPTTDVLAFAGRLPFASGIFDGAVCLSVLGHVTDPFQAAAELMRVVRPGGSVIVDWPFLQPVHGFPHHYFNATPEGAADAFQRLVDVAKVERSIPPHLHPVFSLHWILEVWSGGLDDSARASFEGLTVGDILSKPPGDHLGEGWAAGLGEQHEAVVPAGTRLIVTRR